MSQNFQLAGKSWYISASAVPSIFTKKNAESIPVLILGCLLSFISAAYLYFLSTRSQ